MLPLTMSAVSRSGEGSILEMESFAALMISSRTSLSFVSGFAPMAPNIALESHNLISSFLVRCCFKAVCNSGEVAFSIMSGKPFSANFFSQSYA